MADDVSVPVACVGASGDERNDAVNIRALAFGLGFGDPAGK